MDLYATHPNRYHYPLQAVVPGCAGCAMAHPIFRRSVNPISTRGDRLCPPNYYWHTQIFRPSDGPGKKRKRKYSKLILCSALRTTWEKFLPGALAVLHLPLYLTYQLEPGVIFFKYLSWDKKNKTWQTGRGEPFETNSIECWKIFFEEMKKIPIIITFEK